MAKLVPFTHLLPAVLGGRPCRIMTRSDPSPDSIVTVLVSAPGEDEIEISIHLHRLIDIVEPSDPYTVVKAGQWIYVRNPDSDYDSARGPGYHWFNPGHETGSNWQEVLGHGVPVRYIPAEQS